MEKKYFLNLSVILSVTVSVLGANEPTAENGIREISDSDYPWTYECVLDTMDGPACQRKLIEESTKNVPKVPLKTCILTCGDFGALWPYPSGKILLGKTLSDFSLEKLRVGSISVPENGASVENMARLAVDILKDNIKAKIPADYEEESVPGGVVINISIETSEDRIRLETNESYTLKSTIDENDPNLLTVVIAAETFFGARHGLESLSQLIEYNRETKHFQIVNNVEIEDAPKFHYRGLMIDTARNFIPIKDLKRLVDGLSYNKMSVLHWHISDSNSYPFYSKRVPQMAKYGTFGAKKIYMPEDVREFLNYANQRGIKVIPELDAPAHAGNGWQFGEIEGLGELSLCLDAQPYWDYCIQPPCGQLNPLNENMYNKLGDLYKDLLDVFDRDYFHMGGDEISFDCWMSSEEIRNWLADRNSTDLMDIWGVFQRKAHEKLKEAEKSVSAIVWVSEMTGRAREYIPPEDYVIQIWSKSDDDIVAPIYNEKYRVIFSNNDTVYLDHGYGPWRGRRHAVTRRSWHDLYSQDLLGQIASVSGQDVADEMYESGRLLGGEACMWAEKVDALNMDGKIWPRTSAYAERLWSNPPEGAFRTAYPRLIHQRETMIARGIFPDTLLPESCYHSWGYCDRYD